MGKLARNRRPPRAPALLPVALITMHFGVKLALRLQIAFALAGETTSVETLAFSTSGFGGLSAFGFRPSGKGETFHLPNAQSRVGASAREPSPAWHTYWFGRIGKC